MSRKKIIKQIFKPDNEKQELPIFVTPAEFEKLSKIDPNQVMFKVEKENEEAQK